MFSEFNQLGKRQAINILENVIVLLNGRDGRYHYVCHCLDALEDIYDNSCVIADIRNEIKHRLNGNQTYIEYLIKTRVLDDAYFIDDHIKTKYRIEWVQGMINELKADLRQEEI